MTSSQIRQSFLDFFKSKQHTIVPSSSLMPDSPNLLFTNAGMNQFVPIFLGQTKCPYAPPRAADTQKCIRAGGKHNDLDDVGLDTYHHTFFEMLGNWSFGDYFKNEAIDWAWELITEVWKFPKNRLYATVYSPDQAKGDPSEFDQEAYDFWAAKFTAAGLDPKVHIVHGNKKDNFWMMGETGPCGPCSELHVDLTPQGDTRGALVNKGDARCIEIWNLVFIQFNANPDGTFSPLPARHVDTGMGFERVTSIIQCTKNFTDFTGIISNYETDIFRPIFDKLEKMSGKKYSGTLPLSMGSTGDPPVPPVMGSTGYQPVPPGYQPGGTGTTPHLQSVAVPPYDAPSHSVGQVAQRAGQVARATQFAPGATYSRRNLPHFEKPWAIYHVIISAIAARQLSPAARDLVFDCILHWRDSRYRLVAACVMPDHAHFIIQPGVKEEDKEGKPVFWPLSEILHSIKSFSAKEINKLDNVKGALWQEERYDRYMRSDLDLQEKFDYLCRNPWVAGLVQESEPWPWLWTSQIEAANPYVPLSARKTGGTGAPPVPPSPGSTGYQPVPPGYQPGGTGTTPNLPPSAVSPYDAPSHSVGQVAQRAGQVARATQEQIQIDIAFRVIADHIRTLSFAIADGIQPGNTDRNYVLRRILRRAVRYGRTLGFQKPFFYKLVDILSETMGQVFPEIREKKQLVQETIEKEEEAFNKTLDEGIKLFEHRISAQTYVGTLRISVARVLSYLEAKEPKAIPFSVYAEDVILITNWINRLNPQIWLSVGSEVEKEMISNALQLPDYLTGYYNYEHPLGLDVDRVAFVNALKEIDKGLKLLEARQGILWASSAFVLFDTYGFPLDLTELMARERGLSVDVEGFNKLMEEQKSRARAAQKKEVISLSQIETTTPTKFVGFEQMQTPAHVLEVVSVKDKTAVILDVSAAYAEMGGQVGDTGELTGGGQLWRVVNTQKTGNTWLHFIEEWVAQATSLSRWATSPTEREGASIGKTAVQSDAGVLPVPPGRLPGGTGGSPVLPLAGSTVTLTVDAPRRSAIQRHHSVTHLLHWALHEVVSQEASQKGSFVGPEKLTFDFNHAPLTPQQIVDVEKLVNERILENAVVSWTEVPYTDLKSRKDVMQFFGDKYGELVRVVQIGGDTKQLNGYSMELCGGTHTRATGEIGLFRIVSESAVAAGVRRIEAVAGLAAYQAARQEMELIRSVAGRVSAPVAELEKKIDALLAHQKELEKSLKAALQKDAAGRVKDLLAKAETINGTPAIIAHVAGADGDTLQIIADALKGQFKGVVVLGGAANGAVALLASVSPEFTAKVQAGKIIQAIAPIVGGKGGGKPDNARGGGKDAGKLDEALAKAKSLLG